MHCIYNVVVVVVVVENKSQFNSITNNWTASFYKQGDDDSIGKRTLSTNFQ